MSEPLRSVGARPSLPPLYRPAEVAADTFAEACALADGPAEERTLVWNPRPDRLDCAILFRPQAPLAETLPMVYAVALGLGDALGALLPPAVAVHFRWPDRVEVNGALAGGLRVAWAAEGDAKSPAWLVVGVAVAILAAEEREPPLDRTTLHDEGGGDVEAMPLLESFARHALAWINRWQEDGFAPVRDAWLKRAPAMQGSVEIALAEERLSGRFAGLDDLGRLLLVVDRMTRTVPLEAALRRPTWSL